MRLHKAPQHGGLKTSRYHGHVCQFVSISMISMMHDSTRQESRPLSCAGRSSACKPCHSQSTSTYSTGQSARLEYLYKCIQRPWRADRSRAPRTSHIQLVMEGYRFNGEVNPQRSSCPVCTCDHMQDMYMQSYRASSWLRLHDLAMHLKEPPTQPCMLVNPIAAAPALATTWMRHGSDNNPWDTRAVCMHNIT